MSTAGVVRSCSSGATTTSFRRTCVDQNVRAALAQVTRRRVMMFDRRARTYRCVEKDTALDNFGLLEKAVKLRKAHRNAVDFDNGWIKVACLASEEDLPGEQTLEQLMALHRPATVAWSRPSGPEAHDTGATAVAGASADAADRTVRSALY